MRDYFVSTELHLVMQSLTSRLTHITDQFSSDMIGTKYLTMTSRASFTDNVSHLSAK